jgi:uncharacterized protein (TIGR01777 family)
MAGATGLIGQAMARALTKRGDAVVPVGRATLAAPGTLADALAGCDAVMNFAGDSLLARRWSAARRQAFAESRVGVTERLVAAMAAAQRRPRVLVCASAVGYYGDQGEEALTEEASRGQDYLAQLCAAWETAAAAAEPWGVRVVRLRLGVVLAASGGALARMAPPFRLGVGGPLGGGRQYWPWVHIADVCGVGVAALDDDRFRGPVNVAAPEAATSRAFARALGRAVHRPAVMPLPAWAVRLAFGDAAQVLLASQRAIPARLQSLGYGFAFPELAGALVDLLGPGPPRAA